MHTLTFNSEIIVINQLKHSRYSDLPKLWRANQSSFPIRVYRKKHCNKENRTKSKAEETKTS
ncbi:hypothetical protein DSECCO2_252180 [anaerobic digester metagenome]